TKTRARLPPLAPRRPSASQRLRGDSTPGRHQSIRSRGAVWLTVVRVLLSRRCERLTRLPRIVRAVSVALSAVCLTVVRQACVYEDARRLSSTMKILWQSCAALLILCGIATAGPADEETFCP
ncbi:Protein of unknown function, partial [Gryllus bimaculatus]